MNVDRIARKPSISFIVRLWPDEGDAAMRGEIEHIGTGEKRLFVDHASLVRLLESWQRDVCLAPR